MTMVLAGMKQIEYVKIWIMMEQRSFPEITDSESQTKVRHDTIKIVNLHKHKYETLNYFAKKKEISDRYDNKSSNGSITNLTKVVSITYPETFDTDHCLTNPFPKQRIF